MVTPLVTTAGSHSTPCGKEQRRCSGPPCRRSGSSTTARPLDGGAFILGRTRAPARGPTAAPSLRATMARLCAVPARGGEKKGSWHLLGRGAGEGACSGDAATSSQPRAAAARCSEKRRKRKNGAGAAGLDPAVASLAGADGQGGRSPWAAAAVQLRERGGRKQS